jgi:predicted acylesterase/phospholipase RssA
MSVALSGGGHRASAWGLGTLYGLVRVRQAEHAKADGVVISTATIASVSGGSVTNGVLAKSLHDRGADFDDVPAADFRTALHDLVGTIATEGLIPAHGPHRTKRYVVTLAVSCALLVALFTAFLVGVLTVARGRPEWQIGIPVYLGAGALVGGALAARRRQWWFVPAALLIAVVGVVTHVAIGDTHGRAALTTLLVLMVGVSAAGYLFVVLLSRRGSELERTLDRVHFDGQRLVDLRDASTLHVFCATELQSGHQAFFTRDLVFEHDAGEGDPGDLRLATVVRASASLPIAFPPVEIELADAKVTLARSWPAAGAPDTAVDRLVLADGGVYDNMADEWEYGYLDRILESDRLPDTGRRDPRLANDGKVNFLVMANAGKNMSWRGLPHTRSRVRREMRGLARDQHIEYDETTTQRRRAILRLFGQAEQTGTGLVGIIASPVTSPLEICTAFDGDQGRAARVAECRAALQAQGEHWDELALRNTNVKTTLERIGPECTIDLLLHAATLVGISCYLVHGLGTLDLVTRAEIEAWVQSAVDAPR